MLLPRAALCVGCVLAASSASSANVTWNFDDSSQGWRIADLQCSSYGTMLGTYDVLHLPAGGNPGGHIARADPSSNCYFFDAPANALGDRSGYLGGSISFSLRATHNNWSADSAVVLRGTSGTILCARITPQPPTAWASYSIALTPASFRVGTLNGAAASAAQLSQVLGSLAALRISAEYGSEVEETSGLDGVRLRAACAADLDNDGSFPNGGRSDGGVDINDLLFFLAAFEEGAIEADLDNGSGTGTPDGGVDVSDLLFMLVRFEAGC